ncbi:MAG: hypothetical protein AB4063_15520 [Crocosphaera sp.]
MNLTPFLPLIKKKNPNMGVTLAELLVGSALTSLVVGMAGFGLVHLLSLDQKASAKGTIQFNANRALEFISEEVKLARKINSDAVAALAEAPDFTLPDGAKPVLVLQIPHVSQRIVYYLEPADNFWDGPNVIKRWGPILDEKGQYEAANVNNPKNWESHVLIDSIDNLDITSDCPPDFQPTHVNASEGFNACVNSEEKLVKLSLATTANNKTWHEAINYKVETMAFARSNINQGFTNDESVFSVNDKTLTLDKSATVTFEVLGGEVACSAGGPAISVETNLYVDDNKQALNPNSPLTLTNQPAGTTFNVQSISDGRPNCNIGMTVSTANANTSQVRVLLNDDPVPQISGFGGQNDVDFFLQKYVNNGKINIGDNEAIYLFELAVTNEGSSAFDLQDNVVLATVESTD